MNAALVVILMHGRKAYKGILKTNIRMMKPMMRKTSPHQSPVTTVIKNIWIWMNLDMILQRVKTISTGSDDDSTESESDDESTESESDDTSRKTTEDVWDDMILEVYNTEDYATKVSEYANDYQNAEEYAKRDMLEVHTSDLKFNYYKLLLTYHRMQASKMHKKIMTHVKKLHKRYSYIKALRSAIHYRNSMFRRLLEDDINDEETDDDERTYFEEFFD